MSFEQQELLEKEIEDVLFRMMELEVEENRIEMNRQFAKLLIKVEAASFINARQNAYKKRGFYLKAWLK